MQRSVTMHEPSQLQLRIVLLRVRKIRTFEGSYMTNLLSALDPALQAVAWLAIHLVSSLNACLSIAGHIGASISGSGAGNVSGGASAG